MDDSVNWSHLAYTAACSTWPWTGISTVIFAMRTFSRFQVRGDTLGADDFFIPISWVFNIIRAIFFQIALGHAANISVTDKPATVPPAAFWTVLSDSWSFFSLGTPKLGVAFLVCRVFRPQKWLKYSIIGYCIGIYVLSIIGFIITFEQCHPVAGQWDPWKYTNVKCWNRDVQTIWSCCVSALSASTDIIFSIYPGFVIWNLQMPTKKRLQTMGLMGLGLASFGFAVKKTIVNSKLIGNTDASTYVHQGIQIGIWNGIENDFVLSAACLPAAPPFIRFCRSWINAKRGIETTGTNNTYADLHSAERSRHTSARQSAGSDKGQEWHDGVERKSLGLPSSAKEWAAFGARIDSHNEQQSGSGA